ncbi:MAG: AsmA-like C-terminal region-containing protein [Chthoniobacterales bacterium]
MTPLQLESRERRRVSMSLYRRWSWRRQVVMSALRLATLGLLALLLWGGWYLANKGFSRQWRTTVADELRKRGVEASVRRLTLNPFRGLVAQDLRIYDFHNRETPIAVISEVSLDINYAALLHRQPFLNAIDVRNADVTFPNPGGDPKAPRAQLRQFRAHIYFPPEQIHISQAEGIFCGVRLSAVGQLLQRSNARAVREVSEEEWRQRMQLLQSVGAQLQAFTFAGGPPVLQIKFTGDLALMENARVDVTLEGERMQRGGYEIRRLSAAGEWSARQLNLARLEWSDATGNFAGRGSWSAETKAAEFQARSSVDAKGLLAAFDFGKFLADATFATPPQVELSGSAKFGEATPQWSVLGSIACGSFTYKSVALLGLTADYSWDGARTMLREVRVRHATGELFGDVLDAPGDFRLNLESTINPAALRPLADEGLRRFLSEWEWPRSPTVRLALHGAARDPETWNGEGTIALQRTRFRGVWANSATADLRLADGAVTFANLRVVRDEGSGTGAFTYDFKQHEVRVDQVHTTLRPSDAIYWIEPKLAKVVMPYKWKAPPKLVANGVVQFRGGKNTHLEIGVEAPAGMDYLFLGKTLPLTQVRGDLLITDERVQLLQVQAGLFDGELRGTADISTEGHNPPYSASVSVDGVDFPRLTDLYFDFETARGQLSGEYGWTSHGDDTRTMRGTGKLRVANGNVFAIPVFGPLSGLIAAIIPGAGYSVAKEATANFTISQGVIRTEDFKVSGKLFGMVGHGDIHFLEDRLDFDVRINASGPGVLLTPVYKLFEYKGEGSLAKPHWHPKNF